MIRRCPRKRIVSYSWLLLMLTRLHAIQSFPQPRGELWSNPKETRNLREFSPENGNGYPIQQPNSYQDNNEDKSASSEHNYLYSEQNFKDKQRREDAERDINRAIQEVFYPDTPIKSDYSDISFPEYKLPLSKELNQKQNSFIYGGHSSFQDNDNHMNDNNNILQSRYNPHVNNRLSQQKEVKSPSNNEYLKNILALKDLDLNKISLKTAFLNKAETYNISETADENNFFIEKKVNVSTNLKYVNSHNELANFTDFHSSILQEKVKSGNKNSFTRTEQKYPLKNHRPTEKYGKTGNSDSNEHQNNKDYVGGQFVDQGELLGAQYPTADTDFEETYEDVGRIADKKKSGLDFVAGQFVSYNNEFPSQPRVPQNNNHNIGVQPNDFVGGQFVGVEEIRTDKIKSEPVDGNIPGTTVDELNPVENKAITPTNGYNEIHNNELSSLSILGVKQNKTNADERPTGLTEQKMTKNDFNKKIPNERDGAPLRMENGQNFNKGVSKPTSNFQQTIKDPNHKDEATIFNGVEEENSELDSSTGLSTDDLNSDNYTTMQNSFNNSLIEEEITSTESSTLSSERLDYEDYSEGNVVGSIFDNEIGVKPELSEEIQGQPSQISPNFMEPTKEAIEVVPLDGFSTERDLCSTLPETNTQMVKEVYLYAGKDDENNLLDKRPEINGQVLNLNTGEIIPMTEENMKETYLTEICFPLNNKNDISLFDLLTGKLYLENNGKKIPLALVKNPMTNCTSGTESCKLYVELKNISDSAQSGVEFENEEENLISRNKRQSRQITLPSLKSQTIGNKLQLIKNRTFGYANQPFKLIPKTNNSTIMPLLKNDYANQHLTDTYKKEPFKDYSQPSLYTTQEITTAKSQSRTKRSTRASGSCSCSSLFKSTQIPSYKYFVKKRSNILTDIVLAAKHFKDS